jgi:hypothetical protein
MSICEAELRQRLASSEDVESVAEWFIERMAEKEHEDLSPFEIEFFKQCIAAFKRWRRRAPICAINWCCPYRSDLCKKECTGERIPDDNFMIVFGDFVVIDRVRYFIPERTKEVFRRFDRGGVVTEGEYVFEAPKS